jgi:DNA invertase Pin-like site-specific DNA recombinase
MTEPTRRPVAYIRRSVKSRTDPGDVSRAFQTDEVRKMAGDAPDLLILDGDWGRSAATDKPAHRLAFLDLLATVERGEVSTLYAYSSDRLARSVEWAARLLNVCRRADTTIRTGEGTFAPGDPATNQLFYFGAMMNESALDAMERKAKSSVSKRLERGDKMAAPYGKRLAKDEAGRIVLEDDPARPMQPLLDAYREAGTVLGACKLLDARGVVRPRNGGVWQPASLTAILERAGAALPRKGRRTHYSTEAVLAGLLRCHCGRTLTPDLSTGGYYCANGKRLGKPVHGKVWVKEATILAAVRAEADRLAVPGDAVELAAVNGEPLDLTALAERKRRLALAFADGALDEPAYRHELAEIEKALDRQDAQDEIRTLPNLDWTGPVAVVNRILRDALFEYVQLDAEMQPVEYVWRVPEWRA